MDRNKPIFILLQGESVREIERSIQRFRNSDVYWASMNLFSLVEPIVKKINKKFDVLYVSSQERVLQEINNIKSFVIGDNTSFITTTTIIENELRDIKCRDNVIISDYGLGYNSLTAFLYALINLQFRKIYLFGADGGVIGKDVYYNQKYLDDYIEENYEARKLSIYKDTQVMNQTFYEKAKEYGLSVENTEIINCSLQSNISIFRKIDISTLSDEVCC